MSSLRHLEQNIYQAHFPADLHLTEFVDAKFDISNEKERDVLLLSTYLRFLIRSKTEQLLDKKLPPVELQSGQQYDLTDVLAAILANPELRTTDADALVSEVLKIVKETSITVLFGPQG